MSRSYLKVVAVGNITRDPEFKQTPSSSSLLKFGMAVNEKRGDKEHTEFLECVIWDKFADAMRSILSKGSKVFIEARPRTRSWEDENKVKHYRTEYHVDELVLCDGGGQRREESRPQQQGDSGDPYGFPEQGQQRRVGRFG